MTDFNISLRLQAAQLQATADFADAGPDNSQVVFYSATDVELARITLAKPCGVVADFKLRLAQAAAGGDMISESGIATHATWLSGAGYVVATGDVTDPAGAGPFILGGAAGTQMYAGGQAVLGVTEIT